MRIGGENAGRSYTRLFSFDSTDSWEFCIAKATLDQTLKGRKDLTFVVDNNRLLFTAARFQADFATEPYSAGPELQKSGEVIAIDREQQLRLLDSMQMVYMAATFSADTLFCVDMTAKQTYIGCLDTHTAAVVKSEGVKTPLKFTMPSSSFKTLLQTAAESTYKLCASGAALCAWNSEWEMTVPFVQTENDFGLEQAIKMINSLDKGVARCDGVALAKALETASSVLDVGGDVDVEVGNKRISIKGSSARGKVSEEVAAAVTGKTSCVFKLDATSAINLLNRAPGEFVDIGVTDSVFFIKANDETTQATYVAKLRS